MRGRRDDLQPQRSTGQIRTLSRRYTRVATRTEPVRLHELLNSETIFDLDFLFCVPIFKSTVIFFISKILRSELSREISSKNSTNGSFGGPTGPVIFIMVERPDTY